MIFPKAIAAVLAGVVGLLVHSSTAHSVQRGPLSYVSRIDNADIQTPSHRINALSSFELTFIIHKGRQRIRLALEPNHDIISEGATIQYVGADGTVRSVVPINRHDHRIYKGSAFIRHEGHSEWTNAGWARINVHQDGDRPLFEGAFRIDGDHHHIQTSTNYRQTTIDGDPKIENAPEEYMIVWRDSDLAATDYDHHYEPNDELKRDLGSTAGCASDELLYNQDESNLFYRSADAGQETSSWAVSPATLFGRQLDGTAGGNGAGVNLAGSIGSTSGCPTTRKVALVGIATDCTYTALFNSTESVRSNIIQQVNSASQLYEISFNISLGIQNLTISDASCPSQASASAPWNVGCGNNVNITDRLNLFSTWRGGLASDTNAYWTLLSNCPTGAAVGLAWLGQVCQAGSQQSADGTIAAANVVVRTSTEWLVFAHETGHTFGAVHDCTPDTCSDGSVTRQQCCPLSTTSCDANSGFIMNPSTASGIKNFSPCSIGNICSFLGRNPTRASCLANNKDITTITNKQCGNGIVESGEDCDCGGPTGCGDNPCCNPTTCKFTSNSVCDPSNEECCSSQCRLLGANTVCRASTGSCDPQETCTGTSPQCPVDKVSPDGTGCGTSGAGLTCASGQCTSRDLQCKTMMGSRTTNNDTYSCSSQGCIVSCASPEFGANTCWSMSQYFLDGTSCEGGGKCSNGNCQGATLTNQIVEWINNNKPIFIPVVAVVGVLLILAVGSCCWNCFRRRRSAPLPKPSVGPSWNNHHPYVGVPMRAPPPSGRRGVPPPSVQQQARGYGYPSGGGGGGQGPQQNGRYEPVRTRSFRYA
ncbi:Metallo-peptidase family M12-domain-containing protein [Bombardia bombarda]|uniref:Disintegrin and metalloproteinase domain-containing protein B n=1 Tax=Bombardia bombarda TaxID=252184 RepID=A0AA39XJ88_9PEZI|nr:Metallo-peptidase family M12-domain-containing protein [Bombardia bombarda]